MGRSAGGRSTLREINRDACHFPGFPVLQTLLPKHTNVPELYFLLMALFLQQPITELPDSLQVHVSKPNFLCILSQHFCSININSDTNGCLSEFQHNVFFFSLISTPSGPLSLASQPPVGRCSTPFTASALRLRFCC